MVNSSDHWECIIVCEIKLFCFSYVLAPNCALLYTVYSWINNFSSLTSFLDILKLIQYRIWYNVQNKNMCFLLGFFVFSNILSSNQFTFNLQNVNHTPTIVHIDSHLIPLPIAECIIAAASIIMELNRCQIKPNFRTAVLSLLILRNNNHCAYSSFK